MLKDNLIGIRVLLKGTFGDKNEYIAKVIKCDLNDNYTIRVKYKSNLSYNETIKNIEKNYERWYNILSFKELLSIIDNEVYDAETYKETL